MPGASIRPRLRSRGDHSVRWTLRNRSRYASIRPRLRSRGDARCRSRAPEQERASIRPRLRSRGDHSDRRGTRRRSASFNSATAAEPWRSVMSTSLCWLERWLQFGHGCGAVEMPRSAPSPSPSRRSFNSATAAEPWRLPEGSHYTNISMKLQFGHGCGAVEIGSASGDLGASYPASIRPRLRSRGDLQLGEECSPGAAASIRPRLRSRGDDLLVRCGRRCPGCFNSATAAEPWRCRDHLKYPQHQGRLQFGHGCGAVEM